MGTVLENIPLLPNWKSINNFYFLYQFSGFHTYGGNVLLFSLHILEYCIKMIYYWQNIVVAKFLWFSFVGLKLNYFSLPYPINFDVDATLLKVNFQILEVHFLSKSVPLLCQLDKDEQRVVPFLAKKIIWAVQFN